MEFNPHSLHQILTRIQEQMRCPQCGTHVQIDFPSVKIASDDFVLLQLKCESCNAFIVLHARLSTEGKDGMLIAEGNGQRNVSSAFQMNEEEMKLVQSALKESGGSFSQLFDKVKNNEGKRKI